MPLTKTEKQKLRSLSKKAKKLEQDARKLGREVGKELVKQMRRS